MFSTRFKTELKWLISSCVIALTVGLFSGHVLAALVIGLLINTFLIYRRLDQLYHWINTARVSIPPTQELPPGIWSDITDDVLRMNKRYEKEKLRLQAVVLRIQEMTGALKDSVVLIGRRGNIEWWNKAASDIFGFRDADQGTKLTNLVRDPQFVSYFDSDDYHEPLQISLAHKASQKLEFQVQRFGQNEKLLIVRDVSHLFRLEQMRKDFVANVSHELRTPLTVIKGYLETFSMQENLPPVMRKAIEQMQQQSLRMIALSDDLLTLTKLQTESLENQQEIVSLKPLLEGIANEAHAVDAQKNHPIMVQCSPLLCLRARERELHSAISNLVINAIKYSPEGGDITLKATDAAQGVYIHVIDNGLGIDHKHLPRLTERFYRVDNDRSIATGGTGLGLAIVKHILLRHQGELHINSTIGKGSCFSCFFPATRVEKKSA